MPKKAIVKYRSLRSNLVHLPLSIYVSLAQSQVRSQSLIVHLSPVSGSTPSTSTTRRSPTSAYLGWSGLAASISSALPGSTNGGSYRGGDSDIENVEVDPEVAMSYAWAEGAMVEISVIRSPTKARSVSVTPVSADDWEILEQNANFLENNLLGQLRAAHKGQEIDVWVLGRTRIRVRVDETNPPTTASSAVLINSETEVFVAPRPRENSSTTNSKKSSSPMKQLIVPSTQDAMRNNPTAARPQLSQGISLRYVPPRIAGRWGSLEGLTVQGVAKNGARGPGTVALCSPDVYERVSQSGKHESISKPNALYICMSQEKEETSGDKGGGGGGTGKPEDEEESEKRIVEVEVWLRDWDEIPNGCVTLCGQADELWRDWANVHVSLVESKLDRGIGNSVMPLPPFDTVVRPLHELAGVNGIISQATAYLSRSVCGPCSRPILITGAHGSGKTSIAKTVASIIESDRCFLAEVVYQDVGRVAADQKPSSIRESIRGWIDDVARRAPSILIMDDLDMLVGPENELTPSSNATTLADSFCRLLDSRHLPPGIMIIATATSIASLHPLLNTKHVFGEVVKIAPFTKDTRREVIQTLVQASEEQLPSVKGEEIDFVTLATLTEGYNATDLRDLVASATQQAIIRCTKSGDKLGLTMDDFASAQEAFTPLNLRGSALQKSSTRWADIGGLHEARRTLKETLEWPTKYAQIFVHSPLRLRSGLLLFGYPGCGKTLLASAVARECGLNFISVKGPEILNKYIGASEKAVRDLFERATAAKPCVLFFDEFDSIAPKRGHDSTGVTDRVVNQMLTEMDGAQGLDGVYVLAATSRPDLIDPALLRPGRLDKSILCDMPTESDRLEILQALSRKLNMSPEVDLKLVAHDTDGLSGADLQALIFNAHLDAVHASIAESPEVGPEEKKNVINEKGKGKGKNMSEGEEINGERVAVNGAGMGKSESGFKYTLLQPRNGDRGTAADKAALASRIESIVLNTRPTKISERRTGPKIGSGPGSLGLQNRNGTIHQPLIEWVHLQRSMDNTRPSISITEKVKLTRIYNEFMDAKRDGIMSDGDLGQTTGTRVSLM